MAKDYAKGFYKGKAWQRCREGYIQSVMGLCERCGAGGKIVHHKILLTPQNINDPEVTLNHSLLELLCQDCHTNEHLSSPPTVKGLRFDANGELYEIKPI